jgi:chitin synthase
MLRGAPINEAGGRRLEGRRSSRTRFKIWRSCLVCCRPMRHYSVSSSYDISHFIDKDSDLLDSACISLLRNPSQPSVSKLSSGPSLAQKDTTRIMQSSFRLKFHRDPSVSPLVKTSTTTLDHALNFTLSESFASRTRLWTISCIRPNDSSSPDSFDKRRVKSQILSLLVLNKSGSSNVARGNGWRYVAMGQSGCHTTRGIVEDPLRAQESGLREADEEDDIGPDDFSHAPAGSTYFGEGVDNLLTRVGTCTLLLHWIT